jgi:hypothetical protein
MRFPGKKFHPDFSRGLSFDAKAETNLILAIKLNFRVNQNFICAQDDAERQSILIVNHSFAA